MRLLWFFAGLAVLLLIPFLIWGGTLESVFSPEGAVRWLRAYGTWAGAVGVLLLAADLVLPLPGTVIMSALGYLYGTVAGGLLAAAGSFLSGTLAYVLCRRLGRGAAVRLVGERDLARGDRFFARVGGLVVALSRWIPLLAEVIACMAGLTRMPAPLYFLALACGALPMGLLFAAVGATGVERPGLALGLSVALPLLLWLVVRPVLFRRARVS